MDDALKKTIWNKATKINGLDPEEFRLDPCGALMAWRQYNNLTEYGWNIDHVYPIDRGGDDHPDNLRAMNWRNNMSKGNNYPTYYSAVKFKVTRNIDSRNFCGVEEELTKRIYEMYIQPKIDAFNASRFKEGLTKTNY